MREGGAPEAVATPGAAVADVADVALAFGPGGLTSVAFTDAGGTLHRHLRGPGGGNWQTEQVLPGVASGATFEHWYAGGEAHFALDRPGGTVQLVSGNTGGWRERRLAAGGAARAAVGPDGSVAYGVLDAGGVRVGEPLLDSEAPRWARAHPVDAGEVRVNWRDRSDREDGYLVEVSADGGRTFEPAGEAAAGETAYHVRGLDSGGDYTFRVSATSGGFSSAAAPAAAQTPAHDNAGWYRVHLEEAPPVGTPQPFTNSDGTLVSSLGQPVRSDTSALATAPYDSGINLVGGAPHWVYADSWQSAVYASVEGSVRTEGAQGRYGVPDQTYSFPNSGNFLVREADGQDVPDAPGQKVITFEDKYFLPGSDEDYNDHWWRVEVERASVARIEAETSVAAEEGPVPATFLVVLDRAPGVTGPVTVLIKNPPLGTATLYHSDETEIDYVLTGHDGLTPLEKSFQLHFAEGQSRRRITVTPRADDRYDEGDETVVLKLGATDQVLAAPDAASATVVIRDQPPVEDPLAAAAEAFEWVHNNVKFDPYFGLMKGAVATEQTRSGNAWDQAELLLSKLKDIKTGQGVPAIDAGVGWGRVRAQSEEVARWLDVDTAEAAWNVLATARLEPSSNDGDETLTFNHAWVLLHGLGDDPVVLDPSWKYLTGGMRERAEEWEPLPFQLGEYLDPIDTSSQANQGAEADDLIRRESPLEFHRVSVVERQVSGGRESSLTTLVPPSHIIQTQFDLAQFAEPLPGDGDSGRQLHATPWRASGGGSVAAEFPEAHHHRVTIEVGSGDGRAELARVTSDLVKRDAGLQPISITWVPSTEVSGKLNAKISFGSLGYHKSIQNFDSGDTVNVTVTHEGPDSANLNSGEWVVTNPDAKPYQRNAGWPMALGVNAKQTSGGSVRQVQAEMNALAATAASSEQALEYYGQLLGLAGHVYQADAAAAAVEASSWFDHKAVIPFVTTGLMTGHDNASSPIEVPDKDDFRWVLQTPIFNSTLGTDNPGLGVGLVHVGAGSSDVTPERLDALNLEVWKLVGVSASAEEHLFLEEMMGLPAMSSVKALQWDRATTGLESNVYMSPWKVDELDGLMYDDWEETRQIGRTNAKHTLWSFDNQDINSTGRGELELLADEVRKMLVPLSGGNPEFRWIPNDNHDDLGVLSGDTSNRRSKTVYFNRAVPCSTQ